MASQIASSNRVIDVICALSDYDRTKVTLDENNTCVLKINDNEIIEGTNTIAQYIIQKSGKYNDWLGKTENDKAEVQQYISYALTTIKNAADAKEKRAIVEQLDKTLKERIFIVSNYLTLADVIIYISLFAYISVLPKTELFKIPNFTRHFDLVQNLVHEIKDKLPLDLVIIDLNAPFQPMKREEKKDKKEKDKKGKKDKKEEKKEKKEGKEGKENKKENKKEKKEKKEKKDKKDKKEKKEKKAQPEKKEDEAPNPSKLDIRVGHIIEARKHENAEALYVETIDCGDEEPRTVVSGLVRYMPVENLINKDVIVLCNLKPVAMRGIKSHAMVLCANSADGTKVELINPPANSKPGDKIIVGSYQGEPEKQLNPKKKIFEAIQPGFKTTEEKECVWIAPDNSVHKFMVNGGVCKVETIVGGGIK